VESGTFEDLMKRKGYFYNLEQGLEMIWLNKYTLPFINQL
jgi:hypothetical protein